LVLINKDYPTKTKKMTVQKNLLTAFATSRVFNTILFEYIENKYVRLFFKGILEYSEKQEDKKKKQTWF